MPASLDKTLADIDAAEAQISKVEDREYILPRVHEAGGFHGVNRQVKAALRDWLAETGRELLRTAEAEEGRARSVAVWAGEPARESGQV